jgi:hypothetical protein
MTIFSRNKDFLEAATIGKWNGKDPADKCFADLLKVGNNLALGDVALKIIGLDTLLDPRLSGGAVFYVTHFNNNDVTTAASIIATALPDHENIIPVASTNYDLWHQRLMYSLAGKHHFPGVSYRYKEGAADTRAKRSVKFDSSHYDPIVDQMTDGSKNIIVAAFNPADAYESNVTLSGVRKPGLLGPHCSLATGSPLVPVCVQVEGQGSNPGLLNDNTVNLPWIMKEKGIRVAFCDPIIPTSEQIDEYGTVLEELREIYPEDNPYGKQRKMLENLGRAGLSVMSKVYVEGY